MTAMPRSQSDTDILWTVTLEHDLVVLQILVSFITLDRPDVLLNNRNPVILFISFERFIRYQSSGRILQIVAANCLDPAV